MHYFSTLFYLILYLFDTKQERIFLSKISNFCINKSYAGIKYFTLVIMVQQKFFQAHKVPELHEILSTKLIFLDLACSCSYTNPPTWTILDLVSLLMILVLFQMFRSVSSSQTMLWCWISSILLRPSLSKPRNLTFRRYHKLKMDSLQSNLTNCSVVKCPGNTASALYEPYTSDLNDLLDKHTPKLSRTFTKGPAKWLSYS